MKQYKMLVDNSGFIAGTILEGPQPFNSGQVTGYCQLNQDGTTSMDKCFFKSYVEQQPDIFEEVKQS